jgi:hypothetical protein
MTMSSDVAMVSSCRTHFNAIEIEITTIGQYGCFIHLIITMHCVSCLNDCLVVSMVDRIEIKHVIAIEEMIA